MKISEDICSIINFARSRIEDRTVKLDDGTTSISGLTGGDFAYVEQCLRDFVRITKESRDWMTNTDIALISVIVMSEMIQNDV